MEWVVNCHQKKSSFSPYEVRKHYWLLWIQDCQSSTMGGMRVPHLGYSLYQEGIKSFNLLTSTCSAQIPDNCLGHSIFIHTPPPPKEDFLKFHTPRYSTSRSPPPEIQILCDFRASNPSEYHIQCWTPSDLFFVDLEPLGFSLKMARIYSFLGWGGGYG